MYKSWNVRDQTKKVLEEVLERKYKEIDDEYKMLRKIPKNQSAKKFIDEIWGMRAFANEIEMELMRRENKNGETQ